MRENNAAFAYFSRSMCAYFLACVSHKFNTFKLKIFHVHVARKAHTFTPECIINCFDDYFVIQRKSMSQKYDEKATVVFFIYTFNFLLKTFKISKTN
jgi:hypothetical protein